MLAAIQGRNWYRETTLSRSLSDNPYIDAHPSQTRPKMQFYIHMYDLCAVESLSLAAYTTIPRETAVVDLSEPQRPG